VQLTFQPADKSAQFSLVPCEGKVVWKIGTSPNPTTVACTTSPEDKLCRYEWKNTLTPGATVYMTVESAEGYDANFDLIASSSLTYFDAITPPTFASFVQAYAYFYNETTQYANVTWPDAFAAHGYNNYTLYKYEISDLTLVADNHYLNTSCGVRNFMDSVPTTVENIQGESYALLPIDPSVYTFFTVVADLVDPSYNITFTSVYSGTWVAPNSAAPFVPTGSDLPPSSTSNADTTGRASVSGSGSGSGSGSSTGDASASNVLKVARVVILGVLAIAFLLA